MSDIDDRFFAMSHQSKKIESAGARYTTSRNSIGGLVAGVT